MERFTNDDGQYLNQLKIELFDFGVIENHHTLFEYLELPYFLTYGFSLQCSFDKLASKYILRHKIWNADYDNARFNHRIYNLDRLAISEKIIDLSIEDLDFLKSIDLIKVDLQDYDRIVLDGLICELKVQQTSRFLKWNVDAQMNSELSTLVHWIRSLQKM